LTRIEAGCDDGADLLGLFLFLLFSGSVVLVGFLLLLVTLLISGGLGDVWNALLLRQSLPPLTEKLADLACVRLESRHVANRKLEKRLTELDARVLLADLVTLVVGKEHVRRKTTLRCVGVCRVSIRFGECRQRSPFFFLPPAALASALPLPRVDFSLGMMVVVV